MLQPLNCLGQCDVIRPKFRASGIKGSRGRVCMTHTASQDDFVQNMLQPSSLMFDLSTEKGYFEKTDFAQKLEIQVWMFTVPHCPSSVPQKIQKLSEPPTTAKLCIIKGSLQIICQNQICLATVHKCDETHTLHKWGGNISSIHNVIGPW